MPDLPRASAKLGWFALGLLLACKSSSSQPPEIVTVDGHAEAFLLWSTRQVRNRILVHIDAHDDFLRAVPAAQLARLEEILRSGRLEVIGRRLATGGSELMDEGNFVHAARHVGQVREVYWVVSFDSRNSPGLELADRRALREMGFSPEQVRGFRADHGRLVGELHGIPLTVCGMADLPRIGEPVLLDIDIDLFSILARQNATPIDASLWAFGANLRTGQLRFDLATIARSVADGYTQLEHAYVAATVRKLLASGDRDLSPADWDLLRRRSLAEAQHDAAAYQAAVETNGWILGRSPDDPAAHYASARSLLELGRIDDALESAERAGRVDPLYESGLVNLGRTLASRGGTEALRFYDRAEVLAPSSKITARARGDYHFERRQYRAALAHYAQLDLDGQRDLAIRIGDAYTQLDDYDDAFMYYEIAAKMLPEDTVASRVLRGPAVP